MFNTPRWQVTQVGGGGAAVVGRCRRDTAAASRVRGLRRSGAVIALHAFDDVIPQVKVPEVIQAGESIEAGYLVKAQDLKQRPGLG